MIQIGGCGDVCGDGNGNGNGNGYGYGDGDGYRCGYGFRDKPLVMWSTAPADDFRAVVEAALVAVQL